VLAGRQRLPLQRAWQRRATLPRPCKRASSCSCTFSRRALLLIWPSLAQLAISLVSGSHEQRYVPRMVQSPVACCCSRCASRISRCTAPVVQALRNVVQPSRTAVERCRHALAQASDAVNAVAQTQAAVATGAPPGIAPSLHEGAYHLPPTPVEPWSDAAAREYLRSVLEQLTLVCGVTHLSAFRDELAFSEHAARVCGVPLARGVLFMLLSPEGVDDEDALAAWCPSSRQFVESVGIPWAQVGLVRRGGLADSLAGCRQLVHAASQCIDAESSSSVSPAAACIARQRSAHVRQCARAIKPRHMHGALRAIARRFRVQVPEFKLFVEQANIAVTNYLQALCLNRPRTRRRLRRSVEDWERMRVHALNADLSDGLGAYLASERSGWRLGPPHAEVPGPCMVRRLAEARGGSAVWFLLNCEASA
jgi:hypothetical protein